jgi:hypothetical protein
MVRGNWPTPEAGAFGSSDMERLLARRAQYAEKYGNNGFGLTLGQSMSLSLWPTPAAADLSGGRTNPEGTTATGQRPDGTKAQVGLPNVMKGTWPTPNALDRPRTDETLEKSAAFRLANAGQKTTPLYLGESMERLSTVHPLPKAASTGSTPRASDGAKGSPNQSFGAGGQPLPAQMHSASPWVTPSARDYKDSVGMTAERADGRSRIDQLPRQMAASEASGPPTTGSPATTVRPAGSPNPAFPCWLMGFPTAWLSGADSAMPSSRRSPRK